MMTKYYANVLLYKAQATMLKKAVLPSSEL